MTKTERFCVCSRVTEAPEPRFAAIKANCGKCNNEIWVPCVSEVDTIDEGIDAEHHICIGCMEQLRSWMC